ncbi:2'-5' RNA ligase family protein [Neptunitalea chrysea]|nr:2'-5' RNA ligase family protein [Neptunitalea chrysea]
MDLKTHYNDLYNRSIEKIGSGNYTTDSLIDVKNDTRLGVTLVIRPSETVNKKIQEFLLEVKQIEPEQYFYPNTDIHITLMSIISCYNGFDLTAIPLKEYLHLIQTSINHIPPFKISFKGITASDSCIIIQGFPESDIINTLRDQLRTNFKNSNLQQSIDKRYTIQTAHSTVARFKTALKDPVQLAKLLESYRDFDFGVFTVNKIEFVCNDWYLKHQKLTKLAEFKLETP